MLSFFAGKGFSEVADWLRVQELLKWALAGFAESWACRLWQTQLSTRTHGKKINLSQRIKGCKETVVFLLIMVSSWLVVQSTWLERERVHFPEREEFKSARRS